MFHALNSLKVEPWSQGKNKWEQAAIDAAAEGNPKTLGMAIQVALNFGALDGRGWTAIMGSAAGRLSMDCLEEALRRWRKAGRPPTHWAQVGNLAIRAQSAAALETLVSGQAPLDLDGALDWALVKNYAEGVQTLLRLGARPNAPVGKFRNEPALVKAAEKGREEILSALLVAGGDPNASNAQGDGAVAIAVREGHLGCLRLLADAGADLRRVDANGRSLLGLCVELGRVECERWLGERLARQEKEDLRGELEGDDRSPKGAPLRV
jgi:hypothetical protein